MTDLERIEHYNKLIVLHERSIKMLESLIQDVKDKCDHNFVDLFPNVNIGEYTENCTKCGKTRTI